MEQLKLLIIEDDADQRELIRETLEDHFGRGTVVGVDSRKAALAQDLASFDLILSDYNLPDGTGMELLEEIRGRCTTPVIMVTGENVGHIAAEAIRRGATDYVVKFGDYLFTIPLVVEKNLTVAKVKRENESLRRSSSRPARAARQERAARAVAEARRGDGRDRPADGPVQPPALRPGARAALRRGAALRQGPGVRDDRPGRVQAAQRHATATRSATRCW